MLLTWKVKRVIIASVELYRVKDTCYYAEGTQYCPVLLEIVDAQLKEHYKGNYLLQVWNNHGR